MFEEYTIERGEHGQVAYGVLQPLLRPDGAQQDRA